MSSEPINTTLEPRHLHSTQVFCQPACALRPRRQSPRSRYSRADVKVEPRWSRRLDRALRPVTILSGVCLSRFRYRPPGPNRRAARASRSSVVAPGGEHGIPCRRITGPLPDAALFGATYRDCLTGYGEAACVLYVAAFDEVTRECARSESGLSVRRRAFQRTGTPTRRATARDASARPLRPPVASPSTARRYRRSIAIPPTLWYGRPPLTETSRRREADAARLGRPACFRSPLTRRVGEREHFTLAAAARWTTRQAA